MLVYVLRRLLLIIPTTLGIALVVFLLYHAVPGDPATVAIGMSGGGEMGQETDYQAVPLDLTPGETKSAGPEGVMLSYAFDQVEGNSVKDESGGGLHGEMEGVRIVSARGGRAASFDGQAKITVPISERLDASEGPWVVEAWVKPERDGFICMYCGRKGGREAGPLTVDHFIPLEMDGPDDLTNYLSACRKCGKKKGCTPPQEFCESNGYDYEGLCMYLDGGLPQSFVAHLGG